MTTKPDRKSKIIGSIIVILIAAGLFVIGTYLSLVFLFSGRLIYFLPMVITFIVFILFLFVRFVFAKKSKGLNWTITACVVVFAGVIVYQEATLYYKNHAGQIGSEVDLRQYQPFTDNSKAVYLGEPINLQLTENLPRLDGATALYPIYAAFVQAVYPKRQYNPYLLADSIVLSTKTSTAYDRLFANKTDIIFVAAPSAEQTARAKSMGLTMELTAIGHEAFVFFVNKSNPINNLSIEQIQAIYSGKLTHWDQLSPKKFLSRGEIIPFQRPQNSGSQSALERIMGDIEIITPIKERVVGGMGGIINQTAEYTNYKNAIGYSYLFFAQTMVANNKIRILKINGIEANHDTISNDTYPFTASFYAVTIKEHKTNDNVDRFIDWILSPQGQTIIEKTGYVPL